MRMWHKHAHSLLGRIQNSTGLVSYKAKRTVTIRFTTTLLDIHPQEQKTNSKWITDLSVKYTTIKLLEDNTGEKLAGMEMTL